MPLSIGSRLPVLLLLLLLGRVIVLNRVRRRLLVISMGLIGAMRCRVHNVRVLRVVRLLVLLWLSVLVVLVVVVVVVVVVVRKLVGVSSGRQGGLLRAIGQLLLLDVLGGRLNVLLLLLLLLRLQRLVGLRLQLLGRR